MTDGKRPEPALSPSEASVARRFLEQLRKLEFEHEHLFRDTVDAFIDDSPARRLPRDIWRQVFKRVAVLDLVFSSTPISDAAELCESPIEELLLLALHVVGRGDGLTRVVSKHGPYTLAEVLSDPPSALDRHDTLTIYQQVTISSYRVDFLLFFNFVWIRPAGYKNPPRRPSALVVECDGHEFHEKTKAQAERDKARDRAMQRAGFPVFRFSGSTLWSDPLGCAGEALDMLLSPRRGMHLAWRAAEQGDEADEALSILEVRSLSPVLGRHRGVDGWPAGRRGSRLATTRGGVRGRHHRATDRGRQDERRRVLVGCGCIPTRIRSPLVLPSRLGESHRGRSHRSSHLDEARAILSSNGIAPRH